MSEKDQPGIYHAELSAEEMNGESITVVPDRYEPKMVEDATNLCGPSCWEQQMCEHERRRRETWQKFFKTVIAAKPKEQE